MQTVEKRGDNYSQYNPIKKTNSGHSCKTSISYRNTIENDSALKLYNCAKIMISEN